MARYFSNTTNITQLQATGEIAGDKFAWLSDCLAKHAFVSIDDTTDETSCGWTQTDSIDDPTFTAPIAFMRDHYVLFSMRLDQRKVPAAAVKKHLDKACKKFLADNPNFRRTPKSKREEFKEQIQLKLLAKTEALPTIIDAAWDLNTGIVNLFSTSTSVIDRFTELFRKTFSGIEIPIIHPFARAQKLVDGQRLDTLNSLNQSGSDAVVALIRDNRWIGRDFLLWLLYRGLNGLSDYKIETAGHIAVGETFAAWLDDKIVMEGGGEAGVQKIAVTGIQDQYSEVRSALVMQKYITSATVYIEHAENTWKVTLDGEKFFFKSFKAPPVRIEKDATVNEVSEREAVFYERTYLMENGMQFFDSMFTAFLHIRLSSSWAELVQSIAGWLASGEE